MNPKNQNSYAPKTGADSSGTTAFVILDRKPRMMSLFSIFPTKKIVSLAASVVRIQKGLDFPRRALDGCALERAPEGDWRMDGSMIDPRNRGRSARPQV